MYRFSPIKTSEEFEEALKYITTQLESLSLEIFSEKLPISTLKIFAHYPDEYKFLFSHVQSLGAPAGFNSETSYYSKVNRPIENYQIDYIGVRVVDPYRLHVGCGDYELNNFNERKLELVNISEYVREFSDEILEIWHPDLDVLGYIVPPFESNA